MKNRARFTDYYLPSQSELPSDEMLFSTEFCFFFFNNCCSQEFLFFDNLCMNFGVFRRTLSSDLQKTFYASCVSRDICFPTSLGFCFRKTSIYSGQLHLSDEFRILFSMNIALWRVRFTDYLALVDNKQFLFANCLSSPKRFAFRWFILTNIFVFDNFEPNKFLKISIVKKDLFIDDSVVFLNKYSAFRLSDFYIYFVIWQFFYSDDFSFVLTFFVSKDFCLLTTYFLWNFEFKLFRSGVDCH